jgi:hypothetical protein
MQMRFLPSIIIVLTALTLTSCSTTTAEQYEATALTSYSWQVKYANNLTSEPRPRIETFATTSVLNRQVVKAYPQKTPLELTLGVNDNSVEKAEPVSK